MSCTGFGGPTKRDLCILLGLTKVGRIAESLGPPHSFYPHEAVWLRETGRAMHVQLINKSIQSQTPHKPLITIEAISENRRSGISSHVVASSQVPCPCPSFSGLFPPGGVLCSVLGYFTNSRLSGVLVLVDEVPLDPLG